MTKESAIEFVKKYGENELRRMVEIGQEPEKSMALGILQIAGETL